MANGPMISQPRCRPRGYVRRIITGMAEKHKCRAESKTNAFGRDEIPIENTQTKVTGGSVPLVSTSHLIVSMGHQIRA